MNTSDKEPPDEDDDFLVELDLSAYEDYAAHMQDLFPDVAENYRRLRRDPRLTPILETLKNRGMDDWDIEILFRNMANLPRDWQMEHEPLK